MKMLDCNTQFEDESIELITDLFSQQFTDSSAFSKWFINKCWHVPISLKVKEDQVCERKLKT